jgi:hypothetical protein
METVRVNIAYRPLRICWAIKDGDKEGFRKAVRQSHALWGGCFNPIVVVDRESEAKRIVEAFRADVIFPVGDSDVVKAFVAKFPHLINPFFHDGIFIGKGESEAGAQVLDIRNVLVHMRDRPELTDLKKCGVRLYKWSQEDPLADLFLMQLGAYPSVDEISIDYGQILTVAADASESSIEPDKKLPAGILNHPSISYFARHRLERHYSVRSGCDYPGFYFGDASNLDDLVAFWNLRACDVALWFVDAQHAGRFEDFIPAWRKSVEETLSYRKDRFPEHVAIWSRRQDQLDAADADARKATFGDNPHVVCGIDELSCNGLSVRPPMMHFSEVASLGVLITESGKPRLSFGLSDKPFSSDIGFHSQRLVASLSFIGGLYGKEDYTLEPPYIPELNEFYARTMHFEYNKLRIESERVGLVIDATDTDASLYALPVAELFKRIFDLAGYASKVSSGGLIARQLITQLGGVSGAIVFKIPGVRRLLRTHGPTAAFTKRSAIQLIGGKDPDNPEASFKDHENLYLEPRPRGEKLNAASVFSYLVQKGLFRIGAELTCPHCQMAGWTSLDALRQKLTCEMCGREFDATRQLVNAEWHYRRSGVLGAERNAQGAVPVTLTLQQLHANLSSTFGNHVYSPSLDLTAKHDVGLPACEVDFVWIVTRPYPERTVVILAECKDRGEKSAKNGDGGTIDEKDIRNLRAVADAFPRDRFEAFILLAKLCPFTPQELELAKSLNEKYRRSVILLTDRELEPYHFYDRTNKQFKGARYGGSVEDLALATESVFFNPDPA